VSGYRQMRRQARQARRAGGQPLIVINSGDPLPELAIVVMARLLRRYRSELAPVAVAAALAGAGWWAHAALPAAAVPALAAALVLAAAVVAFGARFGLKPLAERAYASAVILAGGAWLALAAALGPLAAPRRRGRRRREQDGPARRFLRLRRPPRRSDGPPLRRP
jgi:hypothetical protein